MRIALEFVPQDCWVGAFWKTGEAGYHRRLGWWERRVDLWVCLLPCLPLHFTWYGRAR